MIDIFIDTKLKIFNNKCGDKGFVEPQQNDPTEP